MRNGQRGCYYCSTRFEFRDYALVAHEAPAPCRGCQMWLGILRAKVEPIAIEYQETGKQL